MTIHLNMKFRRIDKDGWIVFSGSPCDENGNSISYKVPKQTAQPIAVIPRKPRYEVMPPEKQQMIMWAIRSLRDERATATEAA